MAVLDDGTFGAAGAAVANDGTFASPGATAVDDGAFATSATTGQLPLTVGLTAAVISVRVTTGQLPLTAGLTATVTSTSITTGQLPLTAGLTAAVTSIRLTTGTLTTGVGLTVILDEVKETTGSLTVIVGLTGVSIAPTSGVLRVSTELTSVVGATVRRTTGTLPIVVTLVGYTDPQPPANLVQVRHVVLDASRVPQARVHVAAYPQGDDLAAPVGVYPATIAPAETYTDSNGRFVLNLIPSSLFDPPAPYVIRFAGHRHIFTVPDVGPVNLS